MNCVAVSDLHGFLPEYPSNFWNNILDAEILLICGDIIPLRCQTNMEESKRWLLEEFKPWAASLPVEQVYFIAGNHDFIFERKANEVKQWFTKADKVTYLCNEWVDYLSITDSKVYRIFGTPYCKIFGNWAFMRENDYLEMKYSQIPENTDIVMSHDAPAIFKIGYINEGRWAGIDAGNPVLAKILQEKKPKWSICGHIHSGDHNVNISSAEVSYVNVSSVNEQYELANEPFLFKV